MAQNEKNFDMNDKDEKKKSTPRSSKGKKRNYKPRPSRTTGIPHDTGNINDPQWYVPSDQILQDVANISYNLPLGLKTGNEAGYTISGSKFTGYTTADRIPGIATMYVTPTFGISTDETSAMNIAAVNLYAAIRRANSGAKNYDAPDLMQSLIAVSQAYSAVSWLIRLYGYSTTFSSMNRYIPRALVTANGVNFDSIAANLNDFRTQINLLILQLNAIHVPAGIPIFERSFMIYSKAFSDSDTPQAQIYQYAPKGFYVRNDATGELTFTRTPYAQTGDLTDYPELIVYVRNMINALLYSEDVGTISGDILKAFGESGLYTVPMIPENYSVIPSLSDEIRSQFENAVIFATDDEKSSFSITQDVDRGFLKTNYNVVTIGSEPGQVVGKFVNFHKTDITPADTMVATRLIPTTHSEFTSDNKWKVTIESIGSELISGFAVTTLATNSNGQSVFINEPFSTSVIVFNNTKFNISRTGFDAVQIIGAASAFDWFPELRLYIQVKDVAAGAAPTEALNYLGSVIDYDRGVYIDAYRLALMNDTAVFGLFGVPRN